MRRLSFFVAVMAAAITISSGTSATKTVAAAESRVYVGGMLAGFTLKSGGVQIIGLCDVVTENGVISPALKAELRAGDKIVKINGVQIDSITQLNEQINKKKGHAVELLVQREGKTLSVTVQPIKDKASGKYRIGILARDSVSGIGTVTYIHKNNGRFGALGHTVMTENKEELAIHEGAVYSCSIIGVSKGIRGRAGELRGMFLTDQTFGNAEKLCSSGIYGYVNQKFCYDNLKEVIASSDTATPGEAIIYSTVSGTSPQAYTVEIVKVDKYNRENKNFVVKITDKDLIETTGGIVQGMSGSPIMQGGKMIGAITHVFVNDPTRGYGIDIERMLNE